VEAVKALRRLDLRTFVLGLGADLTSPDAFRVLNSMAEEGGMARSCADGKSCGTGSTCDPSNLLCTRRYYAADNGAQLAADLADALERVPRAPCEFRLDEPLPDPALISVSMDKVRVPPEQFRYEPTPAVVLTGDACTRVMNSDASDPRVVEIRAVYPMGSTGNP